MRNEENNTYLQTMQELLQAERLDAAQEASLMDAVNGYIDGTPEERLDTDLIDAALAKLNELHPERPELDVEAGAEALRQALEAQEGEDGEEDEAEETPEPQPEPQLQPPEPVKAKERPRRTGRAVTVIAVTVAVLMLVANAFNFNPIQYAVHLAETISFRLTPSGEMTLPPDTESEYRSLEEALEENGIDVEVPTWIPEEYSISGVYTSDMGVAVSVSALYSNGESELYVQISQLTSLDTMGIVEKEPETEVYTYGECQVAVNTDNVIATWIDGDYSCRIVGDISVDEMEKILDSIRD